MLDAATTFFAMPSAEFQQIANRLEKRQKAMPGASTVQSALKSCSGVCVSCWRSGDARARRDCRSYLYMREGPYDHIYSTAGLTRAKFSSSQFLEPMGLSHVPVAK